MEKLGGLVTSRGLTTAVVFQCFCAHVPSEITTSPVTPSGVSSHLPEKGFQAHLSAVRAGGLDPGELTPNLANVGKEGVLKAFGVEVWGWKGRGAL